MTKTKHILSVFLLLQIGLFAKEIKISVKNPLDITRVETVSINLSEFENGKSLNVFNSEGIILASQLVDSNQDGNIDEIIFQDSFNPNELKNYSIKESSEKNNTSSKVFAMVVEGREDMAWESNKVAFRMYGPPLSAEVSNGIDVWAKRVESLVVKKWYKEEEVGGSYHIDSGEGADFFSVGKSLGCGGSALYLNDSLYQSGVYTKYKILENGPVRTKFVLAYKYDINGSEITEKKIISIDADSYLNRIETSYSNIPDGSMFVAGIVKRDGVTARTDFNNLVISLWGDNTSKKSDGELGTGVIFENADFPNIVEDSKHLLITSYPKDGKVPVYYSGAGWSRQKDNFNNESWFEYLELFKVRLNNPLIIKVTE
jgi:pectinesterase